MGKDAGARAFLAQVVPERIHPQAKVASAFAAGRGETFRIGRPSIQGCAADFLPRTTLPLAEIKLRKARVDAQFHARRGGEAVCDGATARGRGTVEHPAPGTAREHGEPAGSQLPPRAERDVAPAVADVRSDRYARVAGEHDGEVGHVSAPNRAAGTRPSTMSESVAGRRDGITVPRGDAA